MPVIFLPQNEGSFPHDFTLIASVVGESVIGHGIGGKYIPIMARLAKARCWSKRWQTCLSGDLHWMGGPHFSSWNNCRMGNFQFLLHFWESLEKTSLETWQHVQRNCSNMWRGSKVGEDVPSECPSPDAFNAVRETNMGVRRLCTKAHSPITLTVVGMMIFLIDWSQFQKD